ncbi:MAG: hypothetical protein ACRDG3_10070 [Tepidiformaceae bacterium]
MTDIATLDGPVRSFFSRLEPLASGEPDMGAVSKLLVELASDTEYWARDIARFDAARAGTVDLLRQTEGPCLIFVHRPEGMMGAVHSHSTWVALAPITGTETHRQYDADRKSDRTASVSLREERHLSASSHDVVHMTVPNDIHAHGHAAGIGEAAYILVLTGEDQLKYERQEYDLATSAWRTLAPGDPGHFRDKK